MDVTGVGGQISLHHNSFTSVPLIDPHITADAEYPFPNIPIHIPIPIPSINHPSITRHIIPPHPPYTPTSPCECGTYPRPSATYIS